MAITPRSFGLNPRLLLLVVMMASGIWLLMAPCRTACDLAQPPSFDSACEPNAAPLAQWEVDDWTMLVGCLSARAEGDEAYRAASLAVQYYPTDASLLNLRGYVAARHGDYPTAIYDFRTGQRVTGSPSGVFENNIAWTTLFETQGISPERTERVLLQTRALYTEAMRKGSSCERTHTALYVEYAMADHIARHYGRQDARFNDALVRYVELYGGYTSCLSRARTGDGLVVEELVSAAAMDYEMGKLAGIPYPTRHVIYAKQAVQRAGVLNIALDREWCAATVPVEGAIDRCVTLLR